MDRNMEISPEKVARELKFLLAQGRKLQDLVESRGENLAEKIKNAQNPGHYEVVGDLLTQLRRQVPEHVRKLEERSRSEILPRQVFHAQRHLGTFGGRSRNAPHRSGGGDIPTLYFALSPRS